jgi:hypothetical protein
MDGYYYRKIYNGIRNELGIYGNQPYDTTIVSIRRYVSAGKSGKYRQNVQHSGCDKDIYVRQCIRNDGSGNVYDKRRE